MYFEDNEIENRNQLNSDKQNNCALMENASINKNIYLVESFLLYAHIKFTSVFSLSIICVFQVLI